MTDLHSKRKYAGMTLQEKRQIDQNPAKHGSKAKLREYHLTTYQQKIIIYKDTAKYPTRKARDQAKLAAQKKTDAANIGRSKWYHKYETNVWFEERDE